MIQSYENISDEDKLDIWYTFKGKGITAAINLMANIGIIDKVQDRNYPWELRGSTQQAGEILCKLKGDLE
jgi:ABC-type histidine transport system ATPase subunit